MNEKQQRQEEHQQDGQRERSEQVRDSWPRIYAASLSDYNAGRLHGAWLDANQEPEALLAGISAMLAASPEPGAEEWAIHDCEGFGAVCLSEYETVETVSKLAKGIAIHGPAFAAWAAHLGPGYDDLERFDDCYQGHFDSLTSYGNDFLEALGLAEIIERHVPAELVAYVKIDGEAFGRDLAMSGDVTVVEDEGGGVFVFGP